MHTPRHTEAAPTGSLRSEHAYTELKRRLLAGDFRLGARMKELRLGGLLGVSRTPIREALLRLHAEGLVARMSDGGYSPVVPDVAAIRWLYEVRSGLELQAIQRPARTGTTHDVAALAALVEEWEAMTRDEPEPGPSFVLVDETFHVALAGAAGNPELVDLLRQVNERIRTVRMVDFLTPDRIASTIDEHLGIARSVLAGDLVEAEQRFLGHLDHSQAVVEQRVAAAIARMATAPDMEEDLT
jgi:DNA-binding GntR family transcriptional regulator